MLSKRGTDDREHQGLGREEEELRVTVKTPRGCRRGGPLGLTRQSQLQPIPWPLPTAGQNCTCVFLFSISVPVTLCLF